MSTETKTVQSYEAWQGGIATISGVPFAVTGGSTPNSVRVWYHQSSTLRSILCTGPWEPVPLDAEYVGHFEYRDQFGSSNVIFVWRQ